MTRRAPGSGGVADLPPEIIEHYEQIDEGGRITSGLGQLELVRTQEIVRRHLPAGPLRVLDVGGATGVHTAWLAGDGHRVDLVDVVPTHVQAARQRFAGVDAVAVILGDGRALPFEDDRYDAALIFGPLYHLTEAADRVLALREAVRVVRPGGRVFVAAISRFASLFDGLSRGYLFDPEFRRIAEADLVDGQHRNAGDRPGWFTTAYFHHPDGLRDECVEAGLGDVEVIGVEGLGGWLPGLADRWDTEDGRETILLAARAVETEPSLLGLSSHFIAVTRVPG
jgi:SAM-dependent methyltransferase